VQPGTALSWSDTGAGVITFNVYLDTVNPPVAVVSTEQSAATFTPGSLVPGTTYYWQVLAINSGGSTYGPVWSFTMVNPPPVVNAGGNQTFTLTAGSTSDYTLNGSVTGIGITSINWAKVSAPTMCQVSFNNPNSAATAVRFTKGGTYVLQLAATNSGGTTTNQCTITVNPIYADFGYYNTVNTQDVMIFVSVFGTNGAPRWIPEDLGGYGVINAQDLLLMAHVFGTSYTPTPYPGNPFN
jgi:hypothetical protein